MKTPATPISSVEAPDAASAIKKAIELFEITDPQKQKRLAAQRAQALLACRRAMQRPRAVRGADALVEISMTRAPLRRRRHREPAPAVPTDATAVPPVGCFSRAKCDVMCLPGADPSDFEREKYSQETG